MAHIGLLTYLLVNYKQIQSICDLFLFTTFDGWSVSVQVTFAGQSRNSPTDQQTVIETVPSTETNLTMTGLRAGFNYTITLRGRTGAGLGATVVTRSRLDAGRKLLHKVAIHDFLS